MATTWTIKKSTNGYLTVLPPGATVANSYPVNGIDYLVNTDGSFSLYNVYNGNSILERQAPSNVLNGDTGVAFADIAAVTTYVNANFFRSAGGSSGISGTGFVKASGTTLSYDNSTYTTTAAAASQTADYVITTDGTTITAKARSTSSLTTLSGTDAYTVIQGAITAIANEGSIYIGSGTYTLTNELVITGLGSVFAPQRSIVITGNGFSTQLVQNTASKNGIKIINRAGVRITNLYISCGSSALSPLRLDRTGTSEISVYQSVFDYLYLTTASATAPALYAENFQYSYFSNINAINGNNDAIQLVNNSASVHYGNSEFSQIYTVSSEDATFANIRVTAGASGPTVGLDHCLFNGVQMGDIGDYGIYMTHALNFQFNMVDMESFTHCIAIGQAGGSSQGCGFKNMFMIANTSSTVISVGSTSGSNVFENCRIVGDGTNIPVNDALAAGSNAPNTYDLWLGSGVLASNNVITWPSATQVITRNTAGRTQALGASNAQSKTISAITAMGSSVKAFNVGLEYMYPVTTQALLNQVCKFHAIYLPYAVTLTGVKFIQTVTGSYTGNNYNGVGLYSVSGGTITLVASSTTDNTIYSGGTGLRSKAFSATYNAAAGIYYVALMYCRSAETTAPVIRQYALFNGLYNLDFTNSNVMAGTVSAITALPSTQALSGLAADDPYWIAVY